MTCRTMTACALGWLGLVLTVGCGDEPSLDAGAADTGPIDCRPSGSPPRWVCPAGCSPNDAPRVDVDRGCVTDERVLVWCWQSGGANGEEACFERTVAGETVRVVTGSSRAGDGVHTDAITASGWSRCENSLGPLLPLCD